MVHKCGKGKQLIKVEPYEKTSGVDVSGFKYCKVSPVGRTGAERGRKVIKISRKGALKKYGYSVKAPTVQRHRALKSAIREYGAPSVFKMLQAQVVFRARTDSLAPKFQADRNYVKSLMPKSERLEMTEPARRAWMGMTTAERVRARSGR